MAECEEKKESCDHVDSTETRNSFDGQPKPFGFQSLQIGTMLQEGIMQPMPALKHLKIHSRFGVAHIILGLVLIGIETAGLIVGPLFLQFGNGIYSGLPLIVTGILLRKASVKNNRCCLIAGLVMEIISAGSLTLAVGFGIEEVDYRKFCNYYSRCWFYVLEYHQHDFQMTKAVIVIILSIIGWILSIIHSGFSCHDLCLCCRNKMVPPIVYFNQDGRLAALSNQSGQISTIGGVVLSQGRLAMVPGSAQISMPPTGHSVYPPYTAQAEGMDEVPPAYETIDLKEEI